MSRMDLQIKLEEALGNENVYFQPPESLKMSYPCIRYSLNNVKSKYADNAVYNSRKSYTVILIHKNPVNDVVDKLLEMPYCTLSRPSYGKDGLNHWVFTIYD